MFTKDEVLDESVDLSYIQEAEGYDDFDAVTRIIAENYENEMIVRDYMDKCDRKERQMVAEGASAEEIASFQETSVGGVFQYVKGVMERFWAKIKAFFTKMIQKVKTFFAKRVMKKAKANSEKINKLASNKDYKAAVQAGEDKALIINYRAPKKNLEPIVGKISVSTITKKAGEDVSNDEIFSYCTNAVWGFKCTPAEFKEKVHDLCFNKEKDTPIMDAWADRTNVEADFKIMDKLLRGIEKYTKDTIASVKKYSYKDDSSDIKTMNKAISAINSFMTSCSSAVFREIIFEVNQLGRVVDKAISFSATKKSAAEQRQERAFNNTNTQFADNLNLY